ncbi:MAG: MCE family protein [Verrucomicrobiae bacterium]|nr:MCE family protein [Verrucomicrobiae bacterium]NNJ42827.1 MCE family protein [Akkermansiaceae bacterium]
MPAREKRRERTAGLFVLIGLLLLGVLIVEFGRFGDRFKGHYPLYIEFPDTAGIIKNSEVRLRGAKIGRVATQPTLTASAASSTVSMEMRIRNEVQIPRDSTFQIGSSGLLGDKFIEIIPPEHEAGGYYQAGETIMGVGAGGFDSIKSDAQSIARDASLLIKDAKITFQKIDDALESINRIGKSVNHTMTKVNQEFLSKENLGHFNTAMANFETSSQNLKGATENLNPTITDARDTLASIKKAADGAQNLMADARSEIKHIKPALRDIPKAVRSIDRAASQAETTMAALQNKDSFVGTMAYDRETGSHAKEFMRNLKRYGILRYRDDATKDERDPRHHFRGSRR